MADKKIVDIAGPTDTKVDIGSKPMIVGHKSMASDPMMREKTESKSDTPETPPEPSSSEAKNPEQEVVASKAETIEPPSVKQKTIEPLTEENKPAEKAEQPVTPKPEESDKAEVTDKPEESEKSDKANAELDATALELEKEENLRKIIDSKKYHVNIKQARGESKSWVYVLIGIIFATLIALFVLIDTGKLDVGIKLPFSIFESKTSSGVESYTTVPQETQIETGVDSEQSKVASSTDASLSLLNGISLNYNSGLWDSPGYNLDPKIGTRNSLQLNASPYLLAIGIDSFYEPPAVNERINSTKLCTSSKECVDIVTQYEAVKVATYKDQALYSYNIGVELKEENEEPTFLLITGISTVSEELFDKNSFDGSITFEDNSWLEIYSIIMQDKDSETSWSSLGKIEEFKASQDFKELQKIYSSLTVNI